MPQPIQLEYRSVQRRGNPLADRQERGWIRETGRWILSMSAWTLAALIFLSIPIGWVFYLTGPVLGFPGLVISIVLIPTIATAVRSVRRRRAAAVLGYLQQAIRLNLPLNRLLSAAARSETKTVARRLDALREELEGGAPLSDGLAYAVPEMPMRAIGLIHYAERVGRLQSTIDRLLKEMVGESRKIQEDRAFAYWYPPVLLLIGGGCIGLMGLFVFPKFQQIFQDFHVPLSPITGWVIWSWNVIMPVAPILLLLVLLACAIRLRESVRIRPSTWLFRGMRDRILWLLPLAHSLVHDRDMTDICSVLADSVELGYPLDEALLRAQQLDLNLIMRRRLERWADAVGSGSLPGDAARQARMPGFLAGMLGTGQEAPDLGEVLRFVSRFYASRFMRVRELLRGAYLPLVTLIMGLLVAAVALALFVPMQQLIEDVLGPRRSF